MMRLIGLAAAAIGAGLIWAGAASAQPASVQEAATSLRANLVGGSYRPVNLDRNGAPQDHTTSVTGVSVGGQCEVGISFGPGPTYGSKTWSASTFRLLTGASASGSRIEISWSDTGGRSTFYTQGPAQATAAAAALEYLRRDCQGLPQPAVATPPKPKAKFYYAEATVMCVDFPGGPQRGLTVSCGNGGNGLGGYASDGAFLATRPDCKARKLGVFNVERSGARYYGCGFGYGAARSPEDAMKIYPNFIPNRTIFVCDVAQSRCDNRN
jgi:hypothetical protein